MLKFNLIVTNVSKQHQLVMHGLARNQDVTPKYCVCGFFFFACLCTEMCVSNSCDLFDKTGCDVFT
jgi:hypothetical protein